MKPKVICDILSLMPYRRLVFSNNEIYHIFNRGVARSPIFLTPKEFSRFICLIDFYRFEKTSLCYSHYARLSQEDKDKQKKYFDRKKLLIEIYAYCLMPNHFHLLVKQLKDNGISIMLTNLQNSYAKYFNIKNKRQGPLFQSVFKAVRVETDEQFLHLSRYIHLNPYTSYLVNRGQLPSYPWSSYPVYFENKLTGMVDTKLILDLVGNINKYKKFLLDQAEYQKKLNIIKHLLVDHNNP